MRDALLILTPLLALALVLVLGFAGCGLSTQGAPVEDGPPPEDGEPPEPPKVLTLTFRATVPNALTVEAPGVKFAWLRPSAITEEQADVTAFFDDGAGNNVFEQKIPPAAADQAGPESGSWLGRCEMTVQADGQAADSTSGDVPFELPAESTSDYVLLFEAQGSPLAPPFTVNVLGLIEE